MSNFLDLTDKKFERLLVIKLAPRKNYRVKWECRCDCGNTTIVASSNLQSGNTKSCGCLQKDRASESSKAKIIGERFGRLTVLEDSKQRQSCKILWRCLCDCGNEILTTATHLRSEHTKSCGCYRRETTRQNRFTHGQSHTMEYKLNQSRKQRELRAISDSKWSTKMTKSLKEFQAACVICGSTYRLSIDHVLPLSKGFGLTPGNAVILCGNCNPRKHAKPLNRLPEPIASLLLEEALHFKAFWEAQ